MIEKGTAVVGVDCVVVVAAVGALGCSDVIVNVGVIVAVGAVVDVLAVVVVVIGVSWYRAELQKGTIYKVRRD